MVEEETALSPSGWSPFQTHPLTPDGLGFN